MFIFHFFHCGPHNRRNFDDLEAIFEVKWRNAECKNLFFNANLQQL
jgi:hypothetical protein